MDETAAAPAHAAARPRTEHWVPVVVDARLQLTGILSKILARPTLGAFAQAWAQARGKPEPFRRLLRDIPLWNATVVMAKTNEILSSKPYLNNLIAAVFVANVKIVSTLQLRETQALPDLNLNVPSADQLVHRVYINVAQRFYDRPSLAMSTDTRDHAQLVNEAVCNSVEELLPMDELLVRILAQNPPVALSPAAPAFAQQQQVDVDAEFFGEEDAAAQLQFPPQFPQQFQPPPPQFPQQQFPQQFQPPPPQFPQQQFPQQFQPPQFPQQQFPQQPPPPPHFPQQQFPQQQFPQQQPPPPQFAPPPFPQQAFEDQQQQAQPQEAHELFSDAEDDDL